MSPTLIEARGGPSGDQSRSGMTHEMNRRLEDLRELAQILCPHVQVTGRRPAIRTDRRGRWPPRTSRNESSSGISCRESLLLPVKPGAHKTVPRPVPGTPIPRVEAPGSGHAGPRRGVLSTAACSLGIKVLRGEADPGHVVNSRIVAVANQKVASPDDHRGLDRCCLGRAGPQVLLIDLDPQACLTFAMGIEPDEVQFTVHDVLLDGSPMELLRPRRA